MGQKVPPLANRLGYIKTWEAKWFARRNLPDLLEEDIKIRRYIEKTYQRAGISRVCIERAGKYARVNIYTARPGIVIGKKGADVENLKTNLEELTEKKVFVNILPVKRPERDAQLVAEGIAFQLKKKMPYRRAIKRTIERSMAGGVKGIKVQVAGRLMGHEIARMQWFREGEIPLGTFRADIDYGFYEARTTHGQIGVKVWIYHGEIVKKETEIAEPIPREEKPSSAKAAEDKKATEDKPSSAKAAEDKKATEDKKKEVEKVTEVKEAKKVTEVREEEKKEKEIAAAKKG